ncbi:unnamed protein product [Nesidiocoris tenuis]|uniref:Uncharacterized protein n=1 Tax=Nesidiocoris tenuis TaxID=355587 RepID=A0A6H5GT29_9HEMI|nr:unnamed protein product [Nesidiocoris tenuis]
MNADKGKALVLKVNDDLFKVPDPPNTKAKVGRKVKVLEEEQYLEEMGKIIQRDFFPDLEKVKAQNDYLDAVARNDFVKVREIYTKERIFSPATFDTPVDDRPRDEGTPSSQASGGSQPTGGTNSNMTKEQPKRVSLDQYLANTTSEDNESFSDLLKESELAHKRKYGWLYKEGTAEDGEAKEKRLALPSIEEQAAAIGRPDKLDMWDYKDRNYTMYVPDGVALTAEELIERAKNKQQISYSGTRFKAKPFDESENKERIQDLASIQARALDGKIGVDGKEMVSEMPKVNGYSFVKTPSPAPGIDSTPLMTWGEIEGTPFRLDGSDTPLRATPGPSFSMPEPPTREKIALQLADRVSEQHRDKKKRAIEAAQRHLSSSPMLHGRPGSLDRLQMLSPAARRMSTSITRLSSDKRLSSYYSPSPSRTPGSATPSTSGQTPGRLSQSSTPTISTVTTDDLLNITVKRRPLASDFFK